MYMWEFLISGTHKILPGFLKWKFTWNVHKLSNENFMRFWAAHYVFMKNSGDFSKRVIISTEDKYEKVCVCWETS